MATGHVEQLPSGSWRAKVYAGKDPLTGREIRLRTTCKTEEAARAALGKLLEQASIGRPPQTDATLGVLLDQYMAVIEVEASTKLSYLGYLRRTVRPALGDIPLREIRGPVLDTFYSRLRTCGALCDGRPLVEHRSTNRGQDARGAHDCARAGCTPHACRPMAAGTVRQIAGVLSGAFAAAQRWEWIDHNPAGSAKLPKVVRTRPQVPSRADVATLITTAGRENQPLAVFLWLAAITGARRAELCGLRWRRIDVDAGVIHIARNYVVSGGQRIEKDTKTHQDRHLAIDPATCAMLRGFKDNTAAALTAAGVTLAGDAFVFSNDGGATPWNPDWATHQVARVSEAAGVAVNIKSLRHYTATHLLAAGVDISNTAARLGHGSGGATTLTVYVHPVSEVDRRAAALLAGTLAP